MDIDDAADPTQLAAEVISDIIEKVVPSEEETQHTGSYQTRGCKWILSASMLTS